MGFGIFCFYPCIEIWYPEVSRKCYQWWFAASSRFLSPSNCMLIFFDQNIDRKIFCCTTVLKWKTSHANVCIGFSIFNPCWESFIWITSKFRCTTLRYDNVELFQTVIDRKLRIYGVCLEWNVVGFQISIKNLIVRSFWRIMLTVIYLQIFTLITLCEYGNSFRQSFSGVYYHIRGWIR